MYHARLHHYYNISMYFHDATTMHSQSCWVWCAFQNYCVSQWWHDMQCRSTGEVLVKLSASFLRMWDEAIDMTWLWTCRNCWQGRARSIQILVDSCKSLSAGRLVSWCQLPWPRSSLGRNIAASGGTSNLAESRGKPVREWDTGSHSSLRIDMAHGKTSFTNIELLKSFSWLRCIHRLWALSSISVMERY